MLFRKRIPVAKYCGSTIRLLFAQQQAADWESFRRDCNDRALSEVDPQLYYKHFRAVVIQLMLVAIMKSFNEGVSRYAIVFVMKQMEEHNLSEIDSIGRGYNSAFGSVATDGVLQMVLHFADSLTGSRMREETIQRLHARFYAFLGTFFDDFKSIRLVTLI